MTTHAHVISPPVDLLALHPHLKDMALALANAYAERDKLVTDEALKAMGSALWNAVGDEKQFQAANATRGLCPLGIVISSDIPSLMQLPWETLHHPEHGFLGLNNQFTLSRQLAGLETALPAVQTGPLRILLFTLLPDDLGENQRLDVEEEQAQALESIGTLERDGLIQLEMPDDGRFESFKQILKDFQPHLVYLSGHGQFHSEPHNNKAYGTLLFEDNNGGGLPVHEDVLADSFVGTSVQALVLSACQTGKSSSTKLSNGLVYRLAHRGIPHVIGMRESILDAAGIQFAHTFFAAIAAKQTLPIAIQQAREAITQPLGTRTTRDTQRADLAEISLGQWCLPMIVSQNTDHPLVDWNFEPKPRGTEHLQNQTLGEISLPSRFLGRRRELRKLQQRFRTSELQQLLITGAGGMGKTALAGKLLETLKADGYVVYAYSARPEHKWADFVFELEFALTSANAERLSRAKLAGKEEQALASILLRLLMQQHKNKVVLFFDNLESVQEPKDRRLTDTTLQAWANAARALTDQGLRLLLTSRWLLPDWHKDQHHALAKPIYADFLAFIRQQALPKAFTQDRKRLRRVYTTMGGNFRGVEFFAHAVAGMNLQQEDDFLTHLQSAEEEIQADMALAEVIGQRRTEQIALLQRMRVYESAVPEEGIRKIALPDLDNSQRLLSELLAVSLIEQYEDLTYQVNTYQLAPLVRDWLEGNHDSSMGQVIYERAAAYQQWLFENERGTLQQAITTHRSLTLAAQIPVAYRLVLDSIVGPLSRAGLYQTLLNEWLEPLAESEDLKTRGEAQGQIGKQYLHLGNYDTALDYLKRSLAIRQEVGDKAGEGTTLNNISQIYKARGDYDTALDYLKRSLTIQQEIGGKFGEGATLNNISQIYDARGDYDTALDYLKRSLTIRKEIGDKPGEGTTLNNISTIYHARGDYDTALDYLKRSLAIQQEIGDKAGEGTTLNNISSIYHVRGDYDTALDYLKRSLAIQREIGDKAGEGTTLNNISQFYDARSDYDTALDYLKRSLTIRKEIGDKPGEGTTLNNISTIYHARGDYDTALDYLKRSLAIRQEIGDKSGEGTTLNNISQIYDARSDYDTALDYLKRSLAIRQEIGDKSGLCATLFNIGHLHLQNEEHNEAIMAWVAVYSLAKKSNLAQALDALKDLAAKIGLEDGLKGWEKLAVKNETDSPE